jgi:single-stranded-DNA-specific exonuclease RecJ
VSVNFANSNGDIHNENIGRELEVVSPSAKGKIWNFGDVEDLDPDLLTMVDGCEVLARLLHKRGITSVQAAQSFLDPQLYVATNPYELPDVERAVTRIKQAIASQQRITVYGDYDVDGVTGTSLLLSVLRKLGASVDYYIPNRAGEGYGLNLKAVSVLASKHRTKLIITCDCGVSNFAEINFAKSFGLDTLVLDHHSMPELLPPAVGIVHPKRLDADHPLYHLPGVGVAYKVSEALLIDAGKPEEVEKLLDYVTLGMIADLVPLVRENRYLVQIGLPKLVKSARPGIQALLVQVKTSQDTDLVGFGLAPRINAVGRLADAKAAVDLMTTDDPIQAEILARQLQTENIKRQELCERIFFEADNMVSSRIDLTKNRAIVIYHEGWHHGVVGIVASRLVEKYHVPVFIGELDLDNGHVKGSARGIDGIDLYEVLKANEHLLSKWGGHKMAAGFTVSVDKAPAFVQSLTETCNKALINESVHPRLDIDAIVQPDAVTMNLAKSITRLAPFGMNNKKPQLFVASLSCSNWRPLGKENKHNRIMLVDDASGLTFESVMWNSRGKNPAVGQKIDIVFTPEINAFNGRERLQLVLADWRVAGQSEATIDVQPTEQESTVSEPNVVVPIVPVVPIIQAEEQQPEVSAKEDNLSFLPPKPAIQLSIRDARPHINSSELLTKAIAKLGNDLAIFAESTPRIPEINFVDRTELVEKQHLIFWQFPPALKLFQEIIAQAGPETIYLVGTSVEENDDPKIFLRRLYGIAKYAVSNKDGKVHGDKLAALMAASKMSVALGLQTLRKVNLVDWFAEDGLIYLDLHDAPSGQPEELLEYRQLAESLRATTEFRKWCAESSIKEIQLALVPNHIELKEARALQSETGPVVPMGIESSNEFTNQR